MRKGLAMFLTTAFTREVVVSSLKVLLVVGTILVFINHDVTIFQFSLTGEIIYQLALTYLVPYCVSTYSSVKAIQKYVGRNVQETHQGTQS